MLLLVAISVWQCTPSGSSGSSGSQDAQSPPCDPDAATYLSPNGCCVIGDTWPCTFCGYTLTCYRGTWDSLGCECNPPQDSGPSSRPPDAPTCAAATGFANAGPTKGTCPVGTCAVVPKAFTWEACCVPASMTSDATASGLACEVPLVDLVATDDGSLLMPQVGAPPLCLGNCVLVQQPNLLACCPRGLSPAPAGDGAASTFDAPADVLTNAVTDTARGDGPDGSMD